MRAAVIVVAVALASLTTACGGAEPVRGQTPEAPATSGEQEPGPEESGSAPADEPAAGVGEQVLVGTVGEAGDPEAFTITLTDSAGEPVTSVPAGDYQVRVTDPATMHNFHLTGPGVDEATSVEGAEEVTWDVTLEPGSYTFVCDPHPRTMVGELAVT